MNWLAHVLLSEPDIEMRLGNLLADLVKGKDRAAMTPGFQRGWRCHQVIDGFTDYHPITHQSRARLRAAHGRFAGILIDVFYDHCLARNWESFCPTQLERFAHDFYAAAARAGQSLPERPREALRWIILEDRLTSYREQSGIEVALESIAARLHARVGRSFALHQALDDLQAHYPGLEADFLTFFPQLRDHVEAWCGSAPREGAA